jgi:superfamily II DNA or RNA helicase
VKKTPKLIIADELHSILGENRFADSLNYFIDYLEKHYDEIIKIGLTATPQYLMDYIENNCDTKFKF